MKSVSVFVFSAIAICIAVPSQRLPTLLLNGRIIGGVETTIEEYPFQLSILYNGTHRCGASIINEDWAVTSAQCVERISLQSLSIRSGSTVSNTGGTVHRVDQKIVHEMYEHGSPPYDYDIALVKVSEKFVFGSSVQPIEMQSSGSQVPTGTKVTATGWGFALPRAYPDNLHKVTIEVIDHEECEEIYRKFSEISDRLMCAGVHEGHRDTCAGDYGGPLVTERPAILVGIASWSYNCALDNYPGLYTDVSVFRDWIEAVTGI